jgi:hypothetical protein
MRAATAAKGMSQARRLFYGPSKRVASTRRRASGSVKAISFDRTASTAATSAPA